MCLLQEMKQTESDIDIPLLAPIYAPVEPRNLNPEPHWRTLPDSTASSISPFALLR